MAHPIVTDELALLAQVLAALDRGSSRAAPSEASTRREIEHVRGQLLSGRGATDRAALAWEWNRQNALLQQLRESRQAVTVARDSQDAALGFADDCQRAESFSGFGLHPIRLLSQCSENQNTAFSSSAIASCDASVVANLDATHSMSSP